MGIRYPKNFATSGNHGSRSPHHSCGSPKNDEAIKSRGQSKQAVSSCSTMTPLVLIDNPRHTRYKMAEV